MGDARHGRRAAWETRGCATMRHDAPRETRGVSHEHRRCGQCATCSVEYYYSFTADRTVGLRPRKLGRFSLPTELSVYALTSSGVFHCRQNCRFTPSQARASFTADRTVGLRPRKLGRLVPPGVASDFCCACAPLR